MATSTSVQDMVRTGEIMDVYYYDADTSRKQAFPTTQNTKYVQAFSNPAGGSSTFTIPPNNGIQDIVCSFTLPALAGATGLAVARGWGYALVKQVSYRYGGSSQFFLTGDQLLQNAIRRQPNRSAVDDLFTIGGQVLATADLSGNTNQANIVLTLPHNVPSAINKANPFPTDLLTQQVQITVELNPIASIFSVTAGATPLPVNLSLSKAQFQVQQVMLNNQSDALARRVDMAESAYSFPCEFTQQIQRIPLSSGGGSFSSGSVILTGFRSGEVKSLQCWLTRSSDVGTGAVRIVNPFNWQELASVQLTYAGDVFARYEDATGELWNLINGNKVPVLNNVVLSAGGGTTITATPTANYWLELPLAQTFEGEGQMNTLIHGKPITNGIISLDVTTPSSQNDWILNVSYIYNATLLFSMGTVEFVY